MAAYALAIGAIAAPAAGGICACDDSDGNIRSDTSDPLRGWPKLPSFAEDAGEPMPGFPEDPHQMLKRNIDENPSYKCRLEHDTRNVSCIDATRVRSNGDLRASELRTGRPERIRGTGINLIVDCKTMRAAFQDRDGARSAGEAPASADASKALSAELCTVRDTMQDLGLRMF